MERNEPNEVWIAVTPSWFPYIHGLVSSGIWNKYTMDETGAIKFDISIYNMDRNSHDSLKNVESVTLEYKKRGA